MTLCAKYPHPVLVITSELDTITIIGKLVNLEKSCFFSHVIRGDNSSFHRLFIPLI